MEIQNKVRYLVIAISLVIFCYQINTALHHLIGKQAVDSTEYIPITHLNPLPVITFCPRQGKDSEKLNEYGYMYNIGNLLQGKKMLFK